MTAALRLTRAPNIIASLHKIAIVITCLLNHVEYNRMEVRLEEHSAFVLRLYSIYSYRIKCRIESVSRRPYNNFMMRVISNLIIIHFLR